MPACLHVCSHWNNTSCSTDIPHQSHVETKTCKTRTDLVQTHRQTDCMQAHPCCMHLHKTGERPAYTSLVHLENLCAITAVLDSVMLCTIIFALLAESQGATSCCMKALLCCFVFSHKSLASHLWLVCVSNMLTVGVISTQDVVVQQVDDFLQAIKVYIRMIQLACGDRNASSGTDTRQT